MFDGQEQTSQVRVVKVDKLVIAGTQEEGPAVIALASRPAM